MSVRERLAEIQREMLTDLPPARARELLVLLTAAYYECMEASRKADHAYSIILLKFLEADEAASRAKIRAETSLEYVDRQAWRDLLKFVEESIRSLKASMRSAQEEMRLS